MKYPCEKIVQAFLKVDRIFHMAIKPPKAA